jgi:polyisoprenoid-binding protein YceI
METALATRTWTIDHAHSSIGFDVRHMVIARVRGTFDEWSGLLELDPEDLTSLAAEVRIEVASVNTRESSRDAHLRSIDFFDAEHYPQMVFKSTSVKAVRGRTLRVAGDLTIRGVARPVVLDVRFGGRAVDRRGNERVGFSGKTKIDRRGFGLTWNAAVETGGVLVGDVVDVSIELEAVATP